MSGTTWEIEVSNPARFEVFELKVEIDGKARKGFRNEVTFKASKDGRHHRVLVELTRPK